VSEDKEQPPKEVPKLDPKHLEILQQGVEVWNQWRLDNPAVNPALSGVDLSGAHVEGAFLSMADLEGADFRGAQLTAIERNVTQERARRRIGTSGR
jgi:hypothetical protein